MILRLGQIELYVSNLDQSEKFYVDTLGFIKVDRTDSSLYLKATDEFDAHTLVLTEHENVALANFGLRVSSEEYLDELEALHQEMGIETEMVEGVHPGRGRTLRVAEPSGHPVEFYHSMKQVDVGEGRAGVGKLPMRNTHIFNGIPPVRIDHMNLRVKSVDEAWKYWEKIGFSISEYVQDGDEKFAAWTRAKTSTHDVALVKQEETALHHIAYIVDGVSAVVRTADLLADAGYRDSVEYGPGRHGVSNAFFLYIRDPDGHRIEIYSGDYNRDQDLPPIGWTKEDYDSKGRLWWGPAVPDEFFETTLVNKDWVGSKVNN